MSKVRRGLLVGCVAFGAIVGMAHGKETQPIRLVVGMAAGGGMDTVARLVGQELAERLGRTVIVENRPGASGMIAANVVARAPADGATLLFAGTAIITAPLVSGKAMYDPLASFVPVAMVGQTDLALAVPDGSPWRSVADLVAAAKSNPGKFTYGSSGIGSPHHLGMERLAQQADVEFVHVPYKGAAQSVTDLASGQIDMAATTRAAAMPQVDAGRVRMLALLSATEDPDNPGLVTVAETVPGVNVSTAMFVLAPAGTPSSILQPVDDGLAEVLQQPAIRERIQQQDMRVRYLDAAALGEWIQAEHALWRDVVASAGLTPAP